MRPFVCLAAATLLSIGRGATEPTPPLRPLDFWVGEWTVVDARGQPAGTNRIERVLGGAALVEHWHDVDGSEGKSWFYYLPGERRWKQVWVTDAGFVKEKNMVADAPAGAVRFRGEISLPDGRHVLDQTTLTPLADGTVRQVIEQSADGGGTWKIGFDAIYRRVVPRPGAPAAHHDFDFWLGEWTVTTPDGKPAGTNRIEAIAGGQGLLENWTGVDGGSGKSLNTYNRARGEWQQYWVGAGGGVLELSGGLDAAGRMVLASVPVSGKPRQRITWTPNADGTVRQLWESSTDDGGTWKTAFDGLYRKKVVPSGQ